MDYLTGAGNGGAAAPRAGGRPIEIGIVIDLDTALGRRDLPGEIPGHGVVPREVIADMVAEELPRLRLMVIDEHSGRLVHRAVGSYRPTAEQVAQVRGEYVFSVGPGRMWERRSRGSRVRPVPRERERSERGAKQRAERRSAIERPSHQSATVRHCR